MLVLTRMVNEVIYIGPNIEIKVVSIDRGKVRIGITAPKDVAIARAELLKPGEKPEHMEDRK